MIKDIIKDIAAYQPFYSNKNTESMRLRGILIRRDFPAALKNHIDRFQLSLSPYGDDIGIEGRDGIGRKTQAPWVRIYSDKLSPSATTGYYFVIHFSVDGKNCFFTLGCGASKWVAEKGDLVRSSPQDVAKRVNWAKSSLDKAGIDYTNFVDKINIGSKHPLPKSFENATILCKKFHVNEIREEELLLTIEKLLSFLSIIYDKYLQLKDLNSSDIATIDIASITNPINRNINNRQGYGLSGTERKAVETRAMQVVREYLELNGYEVIDKSATCSYDYFAVRDNMTLKVEVKGTTSENADAILMTANEVNLHKSKHENTALGIVSDIHFIKRGDNAMCKGGKLEFLNPFSIEEWEIKPTAYIIQRK